MKRTWTPEQLDLLRDKYPDSTPGELAILFPDKTMDAIKTKATILGLKKTIQKFRFTEEQLAYIREHYARTQNKVLADKFGCSIHMIENKSFELNLKKDKDFVRDMSRENMQRITNLGMVYRYQKGQSPANKGKKQKEYMSPEAIERTKASRFQKGHLPKNTLHDHAITIRIDSKGNSYKWIRIGLAKWVPYHRYLWEQHNGPIPKGYNIQFRDGNTLNCEDINNLYMISRGEQMKIENSASLNLPDNAVAVYLAGKRGTNKELVEQLKQHPELLELKRTQILLNRKINKQNGSNRQVKKNDR